MESNTQRRIAVAIYLLECVSIAYLSRSVAFPIGMALIGLANLRVSWRFTFNRSRTYDALAILGCVFITKYLLSSDNPRYQTLFASQPMAYVIGQFILSLQAIMLFAKRTDDRVSSAFPIAGIGALVCSALVRIDTARERLYFQILTVAFIVLLALFCDASRRFAPSARRKEFARYITTAIALLVITITGWGTAVGLHRYERTVDQWVSRLLKTDQRPRTIAYSETTHLGSIDLQKIENADAVALRIESSREPGYFRGRAYDQYSDSKWFVTNKGEERFPLGTARDSDSEGILTGNLFSFDGQAVEQGERYDIWPAAHVTGTLFSPLGTRGVQVDAPCLIHDSHGIVRADFLVPETPYTTFVSKHLPVDTSEESREALLRLPEWAEDDEQLPKVIEDVCGMSNGSRAKAAAIEHYFRSEFQYSLRVEVPPGVEPIRWFLKEKPAAHCEYFATATVLLLRQAGVPCRFVRGFLVDEHNQFGGVWTARNKDAHAWAEARDEQGRWFVVESTPAAGIPSGTQAPVIEEFWDHVRQRWHAFRSFWRQQGIRGVLGWLILQLQRFAPVIGISTLLLIVFWRWRHRQVSTSGVSIVFAVDKHQLDPLRDKMDAAIKRAFRGRASDETIGGFASALRGQGSEIESASLSDAGEWYVDYQQARFGQPELNIDAMRELETRCQEICRRLAGGST